MSQQKPGWVNVPGKGRRYWTGSEYRFYGPSDNPASKGQMSVSGDIGGMWNNFVNQFGRSTSDPSKVGQQSFTPQQVQQAQKPKSKDQKPTAPPQAAIPPVPRDPRGPGRLDDPIAGKGPKGNEVGSDSDPDEPGLQGPGDPKGPPTGPAPRVNANGLVSYGKDLSSLNQFTKAFTGGYEVADIKTAFQSNDLPEANAGDANRTDYSYDSPGEEGVWNEQTGRLEMPTAPGTIGGKPGNAQDGTSDKPDLADNIRQVRMRRKGPRDEGSFRGFQIDQANEMAQNSVSETKGNGMNAKRRAIRSAFLDMDTPIIQASVKANAIAGYGKDSDGNARFNYGGKLVYAKDGMQQKAKNAAMMGQDPTQFLDIPATPDTKPDQPADSEISMTAPIKDMTEEQQKLAAQKFAKGFVSDISSKLKDK